MPVQVRIYDRACSHPPRPPAQAAPTHSSSEINRISRADHLALALIMFLSPELCLRPHRLAMPRSRWAIGRAWNLYRMRHSERNNHRVALDCQ